MTQMLTQTQVLDGVRTSTPPGVENGAVLWRPDEGIAL